MTVAGMDFAPRRARSLRFAASFCCLSSSANSRHSAMLRRRPRRATHSRHQNRVCLVTPGGAGIPFAPQRKHGKTWFSGPRFDSGRVRLPDVCEGPFSRLEGLCSEALGDFKGLSCFPEVRKLCGCRLSPFFCSNEPDREPNMGRILRIEQHDRF
jgi:hypothetical protein